MRCEEKPISKYQSSRYRRRQDRRSQTVLSKVFILALDALDYYLVEKWKLRHLMQKQYGKIRSIVNERLGVPVSPQVWGSFITGQKQQIDSWEVYNRFFEWLRRKTPFKWIKGKRQLIYRLGIRPDYVSRRNVSGTTLFDVIPKSIAINVPTYRIDPARRMRLLEAKLNTGLEEYEKESRSLFRETVDELFRKIDCEWDLFMVWIGIADRLGHAFIRSERKTRRLYAKLNLLAYNVNERIPENAFLLIASDHGMQLMPDGTGQHSNYAFYSFNRKVDWKPEKITDFYYFIIDEVTKG